MAPPTAAGPVISVPRSQRVRVAELVDSGEIKLVVSLVLPLEDIQQAHTLVEGRYTRGKIALQVVP
jgi:NADPH:quinone reductase-like Zn-dependent oxidoreductase